MNIHIVETTLQGVYKEYRVMIGEATVGYFIDLGSATDFADFLRAQYEQSK